MDPRAEGSMFQSLPRAFINKRGDPILIHHLKDKTTQRLVEMYLDFPRNCFQGLPPVKDEACVKWVQGMIKDAVNLVALSFESGVVGHAALFPVDDTHSEMLVVVSPPHQDAGIGTELIRSVVQLACDLAFKAIALSVETTNVRARHVYRKCGFRQLPGRQACEVEMALDLKRYRDVVDVCVGRIMNRQVATIGPDDPCHKALERMLAMRVASLPVLDERGQLLGILSQTDLMQPLNVEKHVRDIYSRHVPTIRETEPITHLIRLVQTSPVRCIPVVDDQKKLVGVVSRHEVLAHYARRLLILGQGEGERNAE